MPYSGGTRLPAETASKLGHLAIVNSPWIQGLVADFETVGQTNQVANTSLWSTFDRKEVPPLSKVWAVDGSFSTVKSGGRPAKEVAFVKTALVTIDKSRLEEVSKEQPHPLLLQDILRTSGVYHATAFPLKNVRTSMGTNYDAVRNIVRDSMRLNEDGLFYETLKWLSYKKWERAAQSSSPGFECPHCHHHISTGLPYDMDDGSCGACGKEVYLTDMLGFHLDMDEDSAPDSVASSYMLIMEHLMLFTAIRLFWHHADQKLVSDTIFIKDGPLTLRSQYSKLVPNIRSFLEFGKKTNRPVHVVGQEKSGAFFDHLASIAELTPPHARDEMMTYAPLSHGYVRQEVHRSPDLSNPYGKRTNWGEKVLIKIDPGTCMALSIPTGEYVDDPNFPTAADLIGLPRILATLPSLVSSKFEGALYPIELANGIASLSSYPSNTILRRFVDGHNS